MIRSKGHCNTMGTASTMAVMAEALGMTIPGVAGTPAPDSGLLEHSHNAGRLAVEMVEAGRRPSTVLTTASFHNAIVALAATGGSTNAIVHLLAIAGRLGLELRLDDFDRIGSSVPLLLNLQPAGRYLMDDLHRAGGLPAVLREVADLLDPAAVTVTGKALVDYLPDAQIWDDDVIRRRDAPLQDNAGIAVLHGTLAPDGAVIKPAAASKELLVHRGRAVVFDSIEELHARLDDPDLDIDETCVLVLRGCGPKGYPGMPEAANTPLPPKLLARGVRDLIRISDARMSGTAYGTVVLHVAPESAAGGPLSLVRDGDMIVLDVPARRLDLDVPPEELAQRQPSEAAEAAYTSRCAGGSASTSTTSCRRTRVPTWTSWSAPAATRSPATPTDRLIGAARRPSPRRSVEAVPHAGTARSRRGLAPAPPARRATTRPLPTACITSRHAGRTAAPTCAVRLRTRLPTDPRSERPARK